MPNVVINGTRPADLVETYATAYVATNDITLRERCFKEFRDSSKQNLTDQDRDNGVRVYTHMSPQEVRPTLSRKTGYEMPLAERYKTKFRVIASKCHYLNRQPDDSLQAEEAFMITCCAPNLRSGRAGPENPGDYRNCIDATGHLKQEAYRAEMKGVWMRFLHATNAEAQRNNTQLDVLTPFAGAGAYLEGLQPDDQTEARKIIVETLIEAANAVDAGYPLFPNINEIHFAVPDGASDMYQLARETLERKATRNGKPIILSDTSILELGHLLHEQNRLFAFWNPGSDHVPGGGAYNDRDRSNGDGTYAYNASEVQYFNSRPRALEEQLSNYTNFVLIQNLGENTRARPEFVAIPNYTAPAQPVPVAPTPAPFPSQRAQQSRFVPPPVQYVDPIESMQPIDPSRSIFSAAPVRPARPFTLSPLPPVQQATDSSSSVNPRKAEFVELGKNINKQLHCDTVIISQELNGNYLFSFKTPGAANQFKNAFQNAYGYPRSGNVGIIMRPSPTELSKTYHLVNLTAEQYQFLQTHVSSLAPQQPTYATVTTVQSNTTHVSHGIDPKNTAAFKAIGKGTMKAYDALFRKEGKGLKGAINMLNDYTKGDEWNSGISLFFHCHLGRHHVTAIRAIVRDFRNSKIHTVGELFDNIDRRIPHDKRNPTGSLARRLAYIQANTNRTDSDNVSEYRAGPGRGSQV